MRTVVILAVLAATPAIAHADPDPTVATLLSVTGTALPVAGLTYATFGRPGARVWKPLLATSYVALLVAPSAGHLYAGDYVSTGLGIRIAGAIAVGVSFTAMSCEGSYCIPPGVTPLIVGTLTMLLGAGWDMATADTAAESASTAPRMLSIGGAF